MVEELGAWVHASLSNGRGFRLDSHPPAWLERVRERLHSEFEQPPSLEQLAGDAGVHPIHVAKAFRHHYGCTVGEYIRQRRLEVACHRLATTDISVSRIAHNTGFADHSHFARTVKRYLGEAPTSFRQAFAIPTERSLPG
ncbi:MAG: helix-turn-helix transcriptional regulator [Gemmatimonadetes bacterium]|nr:helix-turn-helix transcriptional regulator [Gemmatimonadota bacterium]